jgi:hypothetical protein
MDIKIKKIGNTWGTIGWLARGLENGTLTIKEGKRKNGKHGLWLNEARENGKIESYFLAGFDPYNNDGYMGHPMQYELYYGTGEMSAFDMGTPACSRTLKAIAKQWLNEMNETLEKEEEITVKLIRIEKEAA